VLINRREIIDESDVYIDVHKAIRRMAPAPKARVQKGHIVENPDTAVLNPLEEHLIDLSEGGAPLARRATANGDRNPSPATFGTSPKTTTFMRRSSGGADGMPIAVRGTVNDMREHLKHLGPSNLASRPKTTRYSTVKIKSGHPVRSDSRTESTVLHDPIIEEPYHDDPAPQGGEGEGLLKSAGKDASDGVQALQQGYGSFSQKSQDSRSRFSKNEIYVDGEARGSTLSVNKTRKSQSPEKRPISRHDSNDSGRSSDTLGSLNGSSSRKKRGNARSGSITENVVEAGGIRKVVLETNSSSDDRDENGNEHLSIKATSATSKGLDGQADSPDDHSEQPASSKGEEVKKKRRRNRKKKSAKAGGEEGSGAAAQFND
jgi:metal transporter CNNM